MGNGYLVPIPEDLAGLGIQHRLVLRSNHLVRGQGKLFPVHTRHPQPALSIGILSSSLRLFHLFQSGHQVTAPAEGRSAL